MLKSSKMFDQENGKTFSIFTDSHGCTVSTFCSFFFSSSCTVYVSLKTMSIVYYIRFDCLRNVEILYGICFRQYAMNEKSDYKIDGTLSSGMWLQSTTHCLQKEIGGAWDISITKIFLRHKKRSGGE